MTESDPTEAPGLAPGSNDALPEGDEAPPPGTRTMAIVRWALVALMGVAAVAAWAIYADQGARAGSHAAARFLCPMHPAVVQDGPGDCPVCGMDLVPAGGAALVHDEKAERHGAPSAERAAAGKYWCPMHPEVASDDPNATCEKCGGMKLVPREPAAAARAPEGVPGLVPVEIGAERRQLMGLKTARAERRRLAPELRAVGFVSANERRVAVVTARAGGWIDELVAAQSGQRVRKGEVLATLYSADAANAELAYLQAVHWKENLATQPGGMPKAAQTLDRDPRRRLQLYGLAEEDIAEVEKRGEALPAVPLRSPIAGFVARKSVLPGQYVAAGTELFQIADLSTVWVVADLLERDLGRVSPGARARLSLAAYPDRTFDGRVDVLPPAVNPESRTLQARMEFRNPDLLLKPGMFGEVTIEAGRGKEVLAVPAEAVVDTGELRYVLLARPGGRFEPRAVKVGARSDGAAEILSGLEPGDEVVTTANFYVDAESRLRAGLEGRAVAESASAP